MIRLLLPIIFFLFMSLGAAGQICPNVQRPQKSQKQYEKYRNDLKRREKNQKMDRLTKNIKPSNKSIRNSNMYALQKPKRKRG